MIKGIGVLLENFKGKILPQKITERAVNPGVWDEDVAGPRSGKFQVEFQVCTSERAKRNAMLNQAVVEPRFFSGGKVIFKLTATDVSFIVHRLFGYRAGKKQLDWKGLE
jgi:hypothetical protein